MHKGVKNYEMAFIHTCMTKIAIERKMLFLLKNMLIFQNQVVLKIRLLERH